MDTYETQLKAALRNFYERELDWNDEADQRLVFAFSAAFAAGFRAQEAKIDTLRHALELIGVGDGGAPKIVATEALVETGIWDAEAVRLADSALLTG